MLTLKVWVIVAILGDVIVGFFDDRCQSGGHLSVAEERRRGEIYM